MRYLSPWDYIKIVEQYSLRDRIPSVETAVVGGASPAVQKENNDLNSIAKPHFLGSAETVFLNMDLDYTTNTFDPASTFSNL